jgi:hypothetical protein
MKTKGLPSILACSFFLALVQLLAAFFGPYVGTTCGLLLPFLALGMLRFFQVELQQVWAAIILPTAASAVGISVVFFSQANPASILWLAPLLACAVAAAIVGVQRLQSRRCGLCNRRLGRGVTFICPRCELVVCDSCWVFERTRCQLCEQNHVPIFSPDGRWWDRELGPRTPHGRCQLCMRPAEEADLRACRHCGRPQCRECWDTANGQCSRCQWTIEDLPEALQVYTVGSPPSGREARVPARR